MNIIEEIAKENIEVNLKARGIDPERLHVVMDKETNTATFLLYNYSGQLVGFQRYNPQGTKKHEKDPMLMKYFTFLGDEGKLKKTGVWGLDSIGVEDRYLFVTEGIFDITKIHNLGLPGIAVLSNDPRPLKPWLRAMNKKVIAIMDNDAAGSKLRHIASVSFTVPDPYKDLGEMPEHEVEVFIREVLTKAAVQG